MKCSKCSSKAIIFIRYSGLHLCATHFSEFLEKRVKKSIRSQCELGKQKRVAVAVSGGKDSSVALYTMHNILKDRKGPELVAITIDEGIKGYRDESIPYAVDLCKTLGIEHIIVSFEDIIGKDMDSIVKNDVLPCSYCGVFRRHCLNVTAKKNSADVMATGLNLDDTVQSILMNLARADIGKLARLGPHTVHQEGLIPRIQPLRDVPENETYLFAMLNEMKFHDAACPHSDRAMRLRFREVVGLLEDDMPGTRHSILSAFDALKPCLLEKYPQIEMNRCGDCGEPTPEKLCKACELKATLLKP
jgi:uncharacterized protein (TIGR00269 family)